MAGGIAVTSKVSARNNLGRFIAQCENAGHDTVEDLVKDGEKLSKHLAPTGSKPDPRTIPLKSSFFHEMLGRTSGRWGAAARHAMYVEKGTGPHLIVGSPGFKFFWESAGRMWVPGLFGEPDIINHPGAEAQPYLEPALAIILAKWSAIAKRHYPG